MRKSTLRKLSPTPKEIAKLANEAASLARRLKNLAIRLNDAETDLLIPNHENAKAQRI